MNTKKIFAVCAAAAMSATLVAGCSGNTAASSSSSDSSASTSSSASESASSSSSSSSSSAASSSSSSKKASEVIPAAKETKGTVTYDVDMSEYAEGKVVKLWLPIASSDEHQTVGEATFDAPGATTAEINTDAEGNQMLYVEWAADVAPADRKVTASFDAERMAIEAPETIVEEGEIPAEIAEKYLASTSLMPVEDGIIKETADKIVEGKEGTVEKARAIYDWIIANMNRDESVKGCGQGDVCDLLEDAMGGKCTDINSTFVALCRAAGIPAHEMFGIRMNDADITKNQHCWAEFYVAGTGWVAADPADVLKAVLKNNWDKSGEDTAELADYYWGNNDSQRVKLSDGRDLTLAPAQEAGELNDFGYPYAEVDGEALDFYTPDVFKYTISFQAAE